MKKMIAVLMSVMFMSVTAFAYQNTYNHTEIGVVNNITDNSSTTNTTVDSKDRDPFTYGVGVDTVVFHGNHPLFDEVTVETRYNIEHRETSVFGVVRVDIFDWLKNR